MITEADIDDIVQNAILLLERGDAEPDDTVSDEELDEFYAARQRSPNEAADYINRLMVQAGTARIPGAREQATQATAQMLSRKGYELRRMQVERAREAQRFLAEVGPYGVQELIAQYGMGGVVEKFDLNAIEFQAWVAKAIPDDELLLAEEMFAESLLHDANDALSDKPVDKVDADFIKTKTVAKTELAGLFNRKRARAAPKVDIGVVQQAAVNVSIMAASGEQLATASAKAARQTRVAKARVAYGTGEYKDPPRLKDWVEGVMTIPEHLEDDYLMLRWVPDGIIEGEVVPAAHPPTTEHQPALTSEQDPTQALEVDQRANQLHVTDGVVNIPAELFDNE